MEERPGLEELTGSFFSTFSDRPGLTTEEKHRIELMSLMITPKPVPYAMRQTLRNDNARTEHLAARTFVHFSA
ncbi:hypothetical protein PoB_000945000 [Plakobranchus ocellatus]|uniref:Uncharacterized protein n=1 Tax=Plakobranchus ocellatus TaxID=259542 RepID=A0AAV3YKD7_9GAST|nr:hypothetical protein PoB_000945000 [Plakobranchus ocellatus]